MLNAPRALQADTIPVSDVRKGEILFRCQQLGKLQAALVQLLILEPGASVALSEQLEHQSSRGVATGAWDVREVGEQNEEEAEEDGEGAKDVIKKATGSLAKARLFLKCVQPLCNRMMHRNCISISSLQHCRPQRSVASCTVVCREWPWPGTNLGIKMSNCQRVKLYCICANVQAVEVRYLSSKALQSCLLFCFARRDCRYHGSSYLRFAERRCAR